MSGRLGVRRDDHGLGGVAESVPVDVELGRVVAEQALEAFGIDINLILAIAIPIVPQVARVIRSSALVIRNLPYVDAARIAGYSNTRIVLRHMMPNLMAPYLIMLTAYIAQAILLEAVLSFLGLGIAEPTPAWGLMLSGSAAVSSFTLGLYFIVHEPRG